MQVARARYRHRNFGGAIAQHLRPFLSSSTESGPFKRWLGYRAGASETPRRVPPWTSGGSQRVGRRQRVRSDPARDTCGPLSAFLSVARRPLIAGSTPHGPTLKSATGAALGLLIETAPLTRLGGARARERRLDGRGANGAGQCDRERGSAVGIFSSGDLAVVRRHDRLANRQT